jgi:hypothetical protein
MPLYYVNYRAGTQSVIDEEGLNVRCLDDALQFVYELVEEVWADDPLEARWRGCWFEIADETGTIVVTVPVLRVIAVLARREYH